MIKALEFERAQVDLAATLRQLRIAANLTGEELGRRVNISQSKLSKIERCRVVPSIDDVRVVASALGASGSILEHLMQLAQSLQENAVSSVAAAFRCARQDRYLMLEGEASVYRSAETYVPGLLQTPEYTRHVLTAFEFAAVQIVELEDIVVARQRRQAILVDLRRSFRFLISERAVAMPVVPADTMAAQLDRILNVAHQDNVEIAVLPLGVVSPIAYFFGGSFVILDSDLVIEETLCADLEIRQPESVATYEDHFNASMSIAITGNEALNILRNYRDDRSIDLRWHRPAEKVPQ